MFSRKVFFRGVEGLNKVWTSKTSLSVSRQDFVEHGGLVISAAKQPEILHVPLVETESGMRLLLYLIKNKPDTSYTRVIS